MAGMSDGPEKEEAQGLGGARADFVASLGRKVSDARKARAGLESDPRAPAPRDELRRKLHALGTSARMMRFDAMAQALAEAEAALESLDPTNAASLRNVTIVAREPDAGSSVQDTHIEVTATPMTVLVVGPESIADILLEDDHRMLECERTED